eukprot:1012502-Pelagomonas_calceolata.AAC.1
MGHLYECSSRQLRPSIGMSLHMWEWLLSEGLLTWQGPKGACALPIGSGSGFRKGLLTWQGPQGARALPIGSRSSFHKGLLTWPGPQGT